MRNDLQLPNTIAKLLDKQKKIKYFSKRKIFKAISITFLLLVVVFLIIFLSLIGAGVIFNG